MNLLVEDVPRELRGCPISTDFRAMVQLELLIRDPEVSAADKITLGLALLFPNGIGSMSPVEAWDALLWYYGGGEDTEEKPAQRSGGPPQHTRRVYDFEQDATNIYAAFRQVYGVDLQREALHWWEFRAMLFSLPDSCLQGRIMMYRATDTSKLKGAEKKRIQQLQKQYAIRDVHPETAITVAQREERMLQKVQARYEEAEKWLKAMTGVK